jgi:hypothetical protein
MPTPITLLNIKDNLPFPNKITRTGAVLPRVSAAGPNSMQNMVNLQMEPGFSRQAAAGPYCLKPQDPAPE